MGYPGGTVQPFVVVSAFQRFTYCGAAPARAAPWSAGYQQTSSLGQHVAASEVVVVAHPLVSSRTLQEKHA